jgi:hypothetical protein
MLSTPIELTDAAVLHQAVVYPLASLVVIEIAARYPNEWRLSPSLVNALRLWEVWDDTGPLATGRSEIVRWLYQNAQAGTVDARKARPDGYIQICRTYRVWNLSPASMSIPLLCSEGDDSSRSPWSLSSLPTGLGELYLHRGLDGPSVEPAGRAVALETVFEYIVAAYGRDQLPCFVEALDQHIFWQALIPAVFGISAAEFEAGWQAYLADQYR